MSEVWKIIADFPDYAVSNEGRVKELFRITAAVPGTSFASSAVDMHN